MGDSFKRNSRSVRQIDTFFSKKPKLGSDNRQNESSISTSVPNSDHRNNLAIDIPCTNTLSASKSEQKNDSHINFDYSSDIGCFIESKSIDNSSKANLLEKHWMPPINYEFPFCVVTKNGKQTKKYAQRSHLNKFHWLVLSHKDQGLYCKYCALFASGSGGGVQTNTPLKRLVKQPLKAFDDLLGEKGSLLTPQRNKYHQMSVEAGKSFLVTYHNPDLNVANQVCKQRMAQVKENRNGLRPIVSTIVLCGRQNIPLRGHRDDGKIILNVDKNEQNSVVANQEGNFRALLRFRIESGDSNLRQHLEVANSNATYISKTVQNELIDTCKDLIQEAILARVKEAKLFSLIFDETTDISHTEQLSLSIRYFYNGVIKEDFLTFCDAYEMIHFEDARAERRLTGVELSRIVEDLCFKFDIDLAWCVGIGTDSCSVMASETKGAVHELSKKATNAKRCPCNNHILNNSLAKSSKVSACRNASATMRKVVAFANASAKRHKVFEEELEGMALQGICETRWVERHDGHLQFQGDNLVKICNALYRITTWDDSKTASDAQYLRHVLCSSEFIIASVCLNDVLGTTVSLSRFLQTSSIDLKRATDAMKDTIFLLKQKRTNSDVVFQQLFSESKEISEQLDVEIRLPRIVPRQKHRENNQPGQTAEEYFRKSIYIPLLDSIIADLEERLSPEVLSLFNLGVFLPKTVYLEVDLVAVREAVKNYTELLHRPHISTVLSEFQLWVTKWKREVESGNKVPEFLPQVIEQCDTDLYPNINVLLQILATLHVSAATAERSFSTLRRLKTWLRSNMGEERLTGLALLNIHKNIAVNVDDIITRFGKTKQRRLNFVI